MNEHKIGSHSLIHARKHGTTIHEDMHKKHIHSDMHFGHNSNNKNSFGYGSNKK